MRDRLKNNFYSPSKFDEINIAKLGQSGEFSGIFRISLTSKNAEAAQPDTKKLHLSRL